MPADDGNLTVASTRIISGPWPVGPMCPLLRLSSAVLIMSNPEIPHAAQVVRQHGAVAGSQPVTLNDSLQGGHRPIEPAFVVVPPGQFLLKLVQLHPGSLQSGAITGEWKRTGGRVIKIFADALEEHSAASVAPERSFAVAMIGVRVLAASTLLTAVVLIRTLALEATITLVPMAALKATIVLVRTVALVRTIDLRGTITLRATVIACSYNTHILTRWTVVPG